MPICPFATWKLISGPSGEYIGRRPFRIVHHTTEGSTAQGAFGAYRSHRSDPHFTVDANTIYQHIDTELAARALRNEPGGVQTNRNYAVQIEVVGFAHRQKIRSTLENVRRLCRWIEETHHIPRVWPNGFPKPAIGGKDPNNHNRNADNWLTQGGHYGHSNVPENSHWDPAYTPQEINFLMLESTRGLESSREFDSIILDDPGSATDHSRMPDHADPSNAQSRSVPVHKPKRSTKTQSRKTVGSRRKPLTGGKLSKGKSSVKKTKTGQKKSVPKKSPRISKSVSKKVSAKRK